MKESRKTDHCGEDGDQKDLPLVPARPVCDPGWVISSLRTFVFVSVNAADTGILHIIVLHFIALCRYRGFYKLKVCGNPVLSGDG